MKKEESGNQGWKGVCRNGRFVSRRAGSLFFPTFESRYKAVTRIIPTMRAIQTRLFSKVAVSLGRVRSSPTRARGLLRG